MTPACNTPCEPHSTILCGGTQSSWSVGRVPEPPARVSEHYKVAFYDKLNAAAGLFFRHPDPHGTENHEDKYPMSKNEAKVVK